MPQGQKTHLTVHENEKNVPWGGGHWDFRFWLFSVFVPKDFFSVLLFIAVCGFFVFKHLVFRFS